MRVLIIANPIVGIDKEKRAVVENIVSRISKKDGTAEVTYSFKPGFGEKYSSISPFEGYNAVFAAGGDGTINDVASGLVGTDIPLGIIPLGTGNGFARGLNIPLDPESFTEVLLNNKTKSIDVGKISSHYFFSTTGIGYDAKIAYDFNKSPKTKRTMFGYFMVALKDYFVTRSEKVTLFVDGKTLERKIFALTVANTPQYGGGAIIAPEANPSSGKMLAVVIPKISLFKMISAIKKLFNGTIHELSEMEYIEFKNLRIKRSNPGLYHVDGEPYKGNPNLNISIHPSSINVIVP
ncbi:diacylglycerol/lipid kinase family protein [Candidatus Latescibacterota bacterium]